MAAFVKFLSVCGVFSAAKPSDNQLPAVVETAVVKTNFPEAVPLASLI
jgi:hypothetical protein